MGYLIKILLSLLLVRVTFSLYHPNKAKKLEHKINTIDVYKVFNVKIILQQFI